MDRQTFFNIRLKDDLIREKILDMKKVLVKNNCKCKGSGYLNDGSYCSCMLEFMARENVVISGAPLEALDVREMVDDGRKLVDPKCKRVELSVNQHEINDINREMLLYKQIIKPYLEHVDHGAFKNGDSLLLFGSNSRGKTWALYFILIWISKYRPQYSVAFYNLKELYNIINDAYYSANNTVDGSKHRENAIELLQLIRDVDMLLIDEGSKLPKFSENVAVQLEGLVKERIGNKKPIIMATNHTPEDFYRLFGPSVVSAFIKNVMALHIMEGKDLRVMAMSKGTAFDYIDIRNTKSS